MDLNSSTNHKGSRQLLLSAASGGRRDRFKRMSNTQSFESHHPKKRVSIVEDEHTQDKMKKRLFHEKVDDQLIDKLKKQGFHELSQFITKNKGGLPAFGYPLMAFEDQFSQGKVSAEEKSHQLWEFLVESVMNNAGQEEKDLDGKCKEKISLLINFLLKKDIQEDQEKKLFSNFTYGKKQGKKGLYNTMPLTHLSTRLPIPDSKPTQQQQPSLLKPTSTASNNAVTQSISSILSTVLPPNTQSADLMNATFGKSQFQPKADKPRQKSPQSKTQESPFMQLIKRIKMNKQLSHQNMQEMMSTQYKIFTLTQDGQGQEPLDFVEWASDLNQQHPIAKAYQNLKKNHFDKLRRLQQSENGGSPQNSPTQSVKKIDRTSPPKSVNYFSGKRAKSRDQGTFTQRKNFLQQDKEPIFNIKVESTNQESHFRRNSSITPNLSKLHYTASTLRDSKSPDLHLGQSTLGDNAIIQNFSIRDSQLIAQIRKHLNLVRKTNEFENAFLDNKVALEFETMNPINVYYQIVQNPDFCFLPKKVLEPALPQDLDYLRHDYQQRCASEQKVARFVKSDYQYRNPPKTSYLGTKRSSIKTMYSTLAATSDYAANATMIQQNQSHTQTLSKELSLTTTQSNWNMPQKPTLLNPQNVMLQEELIQREQDYKQSQLDAGSRRLSHITVGGGNLHQSMSSMRSRVESSRRQPKSIGATGEMPSLPRGLTLNDKDNEEPEMPLTGYNYLRYHNEGALLMRTAQSAQRLNKLRTHADKRIQQERSAQSKEKYKNLMQRGRPSIIDQIRGVITNQEVKLL